MNLAIAGTLTTVILHPCPQRTYSTAAINYDFALITLSADVSPRLGYFGIQRGTGSATLNIASAGYPADKPTGTMWSTTCNGVEYAYGQNQGVFQEVSQCQNQVGQNPLLPRENSSLHMENALILMKQNDVNMTEGTNAHSHHMQKESFQAVNIASQKNSSSTGQRDTNLR